MQLPTVLVAEDDPHIAAVLLELLEDEGFAVRHAWDGAAALEMVERAPPDLVISDIRMPTMNGAQLANRLALRRRRIPVILTSAHYDGADVPGAIFVAKPFDLDHLLGLVRRLIGGGRS